MASYVPESVSNAAGKINDDYNPLAEAKQPSEAHGKFVYVKGMAHVCPFVFYLRAHSINRP